MRTGVMSSKDRELEEFIRSAVEKENQHHVERDRVMLGRRIPIRVPRDTTLRAEDDPLDAVFETINLDPFVFHVQTESYGNRQVVVYARDRMEADFQFMRAIEAKFVNET